MRSGAVGVPSTATISSRHSALATTCSSWHHVGARVAFVDDGFGVGRGDRELRRADLREVAGAGLDVGRSGERRRLELRHGARAEGGLGAVQAGIGEVGVLEREDRALPDVGIDDRIARRAAPGRAAGRPAA